LTEPNRPCF